MKEALLMRSVATQAGYGETGSGALVKREGNIAKALALLLKLGPTVFKLAKSGKFLLLFASFAAYAWLWGPAFAVGALALIGIHEAGHVWAMRKAGLKTRGMYFLPFMGAVAIVDQNLSSRWQEYWLTIMGPVFGYAAVLATIGLYFATGHQFFIVLALFGAFINLVNLLPALPLDGGRILRSLTLSAASGHIGFGLVAAVSIGAAILAWQAGFMLFGIFAAIGLFELYQDYKRTRAIHDWRATNPGDAVLADAGLLRDPWGNPVQVPRELTPMSRGTILAGALAALALAAILAGTWVWASHEAGVSDFATLFS